MGRSSNLRNYLIEGIPQMEAMLKSLTNEVLEQAVIETLEEIGTPTQVALARYYESKQGKHDNESLTRAMQHRWFNKRRHKGLPAGFSRALAARKLLDHDFGFKVSKLRRSAGYFLRIKAWGPGIHLMEKGRYKGVNTYQGWQTGFAILKRFANSALNTLNARLPEKLEQKAAIAAAKNGVKR